MVDYLISNIPDETFKKIKDKALEKNRPIYSFLLTGLSIWIKREESKYEHFFTKKYTRWIMDKSKNDFHNHRKTD